MIDLLEHLERAPGGRYAFQGELGRGSQATAYLARDSRHERQLALTRLVELVDARSAMRRATGESTRAGAPLQPARNWIDPVTPFAPDGSPSLARR